MLRRVLLFGSLGVLALAPLAAQEPRRPARARVWVDGDEVRPFDLLSRRRARIGVTLDMRAVDNDSIGATIEAVTPGGPAAKAGLRSGDIITRFNGRSLVRAERERYDRDRSERDRSDRPDRDRADRDRAERDRDDRDRDRGRERELRFNDDDQSFAAVRLIEMVAKLEPGDTVAIEYRRGAEGDSRTANVVTSKEFGIGSDRDFTFAFPDDGERITLPKIRQFRGDGPMIMSFGGPFADLELAPLNSDLGSYFGTTEGVLVINVPEKNSLGLRAGDVILSVDGRPARGPASLLRVLRSYEDGDVIKLEIMRNKSRQTISSKVTHDDED